MERDENGRGLSKTGRCPICKKRIRVLADEDFECCEVEEKEKCTDCNGTGSLECGQDFCRTCNGTGEE